jgi:hypothetical protein
MAFTNSGAALNRWALAALVLMAVHVPGAAQRVTVLDVGLGGLGSHEGYVFQFMPDKLPPQGCAWGHAYCPASDPLCKSRLAIALLAKSTNRRVHLWLDLDYTQAVNGAPMCKVTNIGLVD